MNMTFSKKQIDCGAPVSYTHLDVYKRQVSLDPIAEYQLYKQIAEFAFDKTFIFISHCLSTTRHDDLIYIFENGRIIEQGSHDMHMKMNGKYAEMFKVQAEKYINNA